MDIFLMSYAGNVVRPISINWHVIGTNKTNSEVRCDVFIFSASHFLPSTPQGLDLCEAVSKTQDGQLPASLIVSSQIAARAIYRLIDKLEHKKSKRGRSVAECASAAHVYLLRSQRRESSHSL